MWFGLLFALLLLVPKGLNAATLEIAFDQSSFISNTTGTFRLSGEIPLGGSAGYGASLVDGVDVIDYYFFSTNFRGSNTANLPYESYFTLHGFATSGTAIRNDVTHPVAVNSMPYYALLVQIFNRKPLVQIYVEPTPIPDDSNLFSSVFVDITGTFSANSSVNSGESPDSQGITFDHLAGTYNSSENDPPGSFTISVPEPSTASLFLLSALPLLFRRRKIS